MSAGAACTNDYFRWVDGSSLKGTGYSNWAGGGPNCNYSPTGSWVNERHCVTATWSKPNASMGGAFMWDVNDCHTGYDTWYKRPLSMCKTLSECSGLANCMKM